MVTAQTGVVCVVLVWRSSGRQGWTNPRVKTDTVWIWTMLNGWGTFPERFGSQIGAGHGLLPAHLACQLGIIYIMLDFFSKVEGSFTYVNRKRYKAFVHHQGLCATLEFLLDYNCDICREEQHAGIC